MSSSNLIRWGAIGSMLAGGLWLAGEIVWIVWATVLFPGPPTPLRAGLLLLRNLIALVGMLAGLAGLHALQATRYGRPGRVGFLVTSIGVALMLVGLYYVPFVWLGGLLLGGGFALLGVATLRAGGLPRWVGVVFIVGVLQIDNPIFFLPYPLVEGLGAGPAFLVAPVVYGAVWLALGYALLTRRETPAQQDQRTR